MAQSSPPAPPEAPQDQPEASQASPSAKAKVKAKAKPKAKSKAKPKAKPEAIPVEQYEVEVKNDLDGIESTTVDEKVILMDWDADKLIAKWEECTGEKWDPKQSMNPNLRKKFVAIVADVLAGITPGPGVK